MTVKTLDLDGRVVARSAACFGRRTEEEIQIMARKWIAHNMKGAEWPEDDWHELADDLDINLWMWEDDNGAPVRHATVYPVVNGRAQVDIWLRISLDGLRV